MLEAITAFPSLDPVLYMAGGEISECVHPHLKLRVVFMHAHTRFTFKIRMCNYRHVSFCATYIYVVV